MGILDVPSYSRGAADKRYRKRVDVRDHGAVADGASGTPTNNMAAFALAKAEAIEKDWSVYVPKGHYRASPGSDAAVFTLTTEGPLAGLNQLVGDGPQAAIVEVTSASGRGLDVGVYGTHFLELSNPVTVSGLTFRGPGSGTGVGIRGRNMAKARLTNVEVDRFGSHGVDLRNSNSWSIHNLRSRRNGGAGLFGMYVTSRDAADPGVGLAESNSANHGLALSGVTLLEDNVGHGLHMRSAYALNLGDVFIPQRNGGRGLYLEEILGLEAAAIYAEANVGDQIRLGNPSGGAATGCRQVNLMAFINKAGGGGTGVYAYACAGANLDVYAGGFTVAGDRAVVLDTSFTGSIEGRSTPGTGKFLQLPDGTLIDNTDEKFRFGSASTRGTDPAKVAMAIRAAAGQTARILEVFDGAGASVFYVQDDGIARAVKNVVLERNVSVGANSGSGGGVVVVPIQNATTLPTTNPGNGGVMYVEGGALKWRGSGGTVTTIAPA